MIELVHERLDNRCRVVDFGLQQFTGALVQPDQPVIGQHDMGHHGQTAADDHREQQVFDGRPCRRGIDVEQERDGSPPTPHSPRDIRIRATAYVTARNTTATTAAEEPVGCHTIVSTDANTIPTAIPATRPTQRV